MFASLLFAAIIALTPNELTPCNDAGEVLALKAVTENTSQAVTVKSVDELRVYTNAYATVATPHICYYFTFTNFDGNAAIATNLFDRFDHADWRTNGVSKIVGPAGVKQFETNFFSKVYAGKLLKSTTLVTNDLINGTAASNYLLKQPQSTTVLTPCMLLLTSGTNDIVTIITK